MSTAFDNNLKVITTLVELFCKGLEWKMDSNRDWCAVVIPATAVGGCMLEIIPHEDYLFTVRCNISLPKSKLHRTLDLTSGCGGCDVKDPENLEFLENRLHGVFQDYIKHLILDLIALENWP